MKTTTRRTGRAFTLVELLVVIAIIGILVALLMPMATKAMTRARMTQTMSNGRTLYQSLVAEISSEPTAIYPQSQGAKRYTDSTSYFRWMVTNELIDVTFEFFSAPGLPAYVGDDPAKFTAEDNAWCITADVYDGTRSSTPLLFTRNLAIQRLDEAPTGKLADQPPFGQEGVIVVYKAGGTTILRDKDLETRFNPVGATNTVLRP